MQPVIGITSRAKSVPSVGSHLLAHTVFHTYTDSVISAGGIPVMLVPVHHDSIADIFERIDGLVITGGGDIAPERYGRSRHETVAEVDDERDRFEIELVHRALAARIPTLAICRGLQVVNVALGGTLIQDLPSHTGAAGHDMIGDAAYEAHSIVRIDKGSRIAEIIGAGDHGVNSIHHQAVEDPGHGVRVVGSAPDGTIEAIEHEDRDWDLIAVQWHPEFLGARDHGPSHELFRAFVESAGKYRADR
ncbi:MAG: gamma-glutamyl-gamma-aminobutyrate hydrolase family protein [Acidimicrobiia bacterium]